MATAVPALLQNQTPIPLFLSSDHVCLFHDMLRMSASHYFTPIPPFNCLKMRFNSYLQIIFIVVVHTPAKSGENPTRRMFSHEGLNFLACKRMCWKGAFRHSDVRTRFSICCLGYLMDWYYTCLGCLIQISYTFVTCCLNIVRDMFLFIFTDDKSTHCFHLAPAQQKKKIPTFLFILTRDGQQEGWHWQYQHDPTVIMCIIDHIISYYLACVFIFYQVGGKTFRTLLQALKLVSHTLIYQVIIDVR